MNVKSELPRQWVSEFYRHVLARSKTRSRRIIDQAPEKRGEWAEGFIHGMEGIVESLGNGETLVGRMMDGVSKKQVDVWRRGFQARCESPLTPEFDRGYFSAYVGLLRAFNRN